jgi:hypothetical protein
VQADKNQAAVANPVAKRRKAAGLSDNEWLMWITPLND